MISVYWFGYGGSSYLAEELRPMIEELGMSLTTIHEHENADIKWNRETYKNELAKADIIIIPCNYEEQEAKSNNRLTQAFSLGKPVICSPLPAYERILNKYPKAAFIAVGKDFWEKQLQLLRDSPNLRAEMSKAALEAAKEFSIDNIGNQWLNLFNNLEKVDIVIPTYNNVKCLSLCIESIRQCTDFLHNIIIVNNSSNEETTKYLEQQGDIMHVKTGRLNFSQAINLGIKSGNSKYVCLLNDDTIVSNGWLNHLVQSCTEGIGAVGPLSNCDKGWLHDFNIEIETEIEIEVDDDENENI